MELGQESFYCFWQAFKPITANNEDIFDPRGLPGEHTHQPRMKRLLPYSDPNTKDVFNPIHIHTDSKVR